MGDAYTPKLRRLLDMSAHLPIVHDRRSQLSSPHTAHTRGDIYVFFRDSNVLAVGDVASPLRDPALDYFTGAWIAA